MVFPQPDRIQTGDSVSSEMVRYSFMAPSDTWIEILIYGLMYGYCNAYAWQQAGAVTVEHAVEVFTRIWESVTVISDTGTIIAYAGLAAPANTLPCDGSSYLRADYPNLFLKIGVIWGSADSDHFNVPDLRGRTLVGLGTGPGLSPRTIGSESGEEEHQLITAEMPSHSHADLGHSHTIPFFVLTGTAVPPPVDGGTQLPLITSTTGVGNAALTNTGGDGAHNNMQPFAVVNYAIVT
jgi:microcystin-dependent protein